MKCPFRTIETEDIVEYGGEALYNKKGVVRRKSEQTFQDCLKEECMAYRKHRRTEMCQKFPMGYYKDILD